jgi:ATP-dependent RNA helicase DOB1
MSKKIKEAKCIVLKKEKKAYIRVIKRVGLVEKGVVTRKGNVACEISGNHEILLTELLFAGFFNDLSPAEISAILSTLLNEERSSTNQKTATKSPKFKKKLQELIV